MLPRICIGPIGCSSYRLFEAHKQYSSDSIEKDSKKKIKKRHTLPTIWHSSSERSKPCSLFRLLVYHHHSRVVFDITRIELEKANPKQTFIIMVNFRFVMKFHCDQVQFGNLFIVPCDFDRLELTRSCGAKTFKKWFLVCAM